MSEDINESNETNIKGPSLGEDHSRSSSSDLHKDISATLSGFADSAALSGISMLSGILGSTLSESVAGVPFASVVGSGLSSWAGSEKIEDEIRDLSQKIHGQAEVISRLNEEGKDYSEKIDALNNTLKDLEDKERLKHLLTRVGEKGRKSLLRDGKLKEKFDENETCCAYIMSIDLRRSTELMLKARNPKGFADFITKLTMKLREIIINSYGIYDKFTGDGVLAFFPEFYSGPMAGLLAVSAAEACHEAFDVHYRINRKCFNSIIKETGLGVGIDYGEVSMVQMQGELTVVGTPVVYACRLGGANAGDTLVNQPAYEELLSRYSEFVEFRETEIGFNHEGAMVVNKVSRNEKTYKVEDPEWV